MKSEGFLELPAVDGPSDSVLSDVGFVGAADDVSFTVVAWVSLADVGVGVVPAEDSCVEFEVVFFSVGTVLDSSVTDSGVAVMFPAGVVLPGLVGNRVEL